MTLTFEYDKKEYTLEYTRRTVEQMEQSGFNIRDLRNKPVTTVPLLFAGAFLANHRSVRQELITEIYNHIENRGDLISALIDMYNEPASTLLNEPEENEGNVRGWKVIR